MFRSTDDLNIIKKRKKILTSWDYIRHPANRKQHPLDCGRTECFCCHYNKYPKRIPTRQEQLADRKLNED